MKYANAFAITAFSMILVSCSQDEVAAPRSAEAIFENAMAKFEDESYQEAYEEFRLLSLQYPGSAFSDDAQFLMGECKYKREEYILAAYEYEVLVRTNPTSDFVPNARFMRAMCFYQSSRVSFLDQENTGKAIDEFQAFIEYHPTDPRVSEAEQHISEMNAKLAKKEYENGGIYMKMEYYRAAGIYFDLILEKYHDSPYAEPAMFRKAEALYNRKRYREAGETLNRFLERFPESALVGDARALLADVEKAMAETNASAQKATSDSNKITNP